MGFEHIFDLIPRSIAGCAALSASRPSRGYMQFLGIRPQVSMPEAACHENKRGPPSRRLGGRAC
eukprot:2145902-Amphidinium_carterae.1